MTGDISIKNIKFAFLAIAKIKNWPQYFFDLLNLTKKDKIIYELRDGTKFEVRAKTTDRGIITSVVLLDEYKIEKTNFSKDAVIIDIGGQAGIFAIFASRRSAKVYTYEPTKENYAMLKRNININNLQKKVLANKNAVSDTEKTLKIYLSEDNTGGHSAYGAGNGTSTYEKVSAISLKSILDKNSIKKCELLKIDAEGSEYDILYNLPKKYFSNIKNIHMEYHDIDRKMKNHKSLIKFLKDLKYRVEYSEGLLYASKD